MGFWKRAKKLLGTDNMLHWFSGTVKSENGITTVDGNPEVNPDRVVLGTDLPFPDNHFDSSFADPPYSPKDAKRYNLPYPSSRKVLTELARVTKPGGRIGILHKFIPVSKGLPIKLIGVIGITGGPLKSVKAFCIYEKEKL